MFSKIPKIRKLQTKTGPSGVAVVKHHHPTLLQDTRRLKQLSYFYRLVPALYCWQVSN